MKSHPRVKVALILIAFVVVSIGLTFIWNEWLRALYGQFFQIVAPPIYDAIGLGHARVASLRTRYINFVPFVALIVVTPGLPIVRRSVGLIAGLFAISAGHLALNLTALIQPGVSLPVVAALVSDTFPFVVWFVIAYPVLVDLIPMAPSIESDEAPEDV